MPLTASMKQSEVGLISTDWELVPIQDLLEKNTRITYGVVQPGREDPDGVLFVRGGDVFDGAIAENTLRTISKSVAAQYKRTTLLGGELLISLVGYPGECALVPTSLIGANIARQVAAVRFRRLNEFTPAFVCHLLRSTIGKRLLLKDAFGSAQQVINLRDVNKLCLPLPKLPEEQRAIATALSDVDALIAGLERLIAKKRDIKQATMQQLLTGKTRLPGFSGAWTQGVLGDVVKSLDAGVSVNSTDAVPEDGVPGVLKTSALVGGTFIPSEVKVIEARDIPRARTSPKADTVLVSRMNTPMLVGEVAYVHRDFDSIFLPDRIWMARFNSSKHVSVRWVALLLSSRIYRDLLRDVATGTSGSMKNISKAALLSLPILFPNPEEQTAIATVLSDMDTDIEALEARLAKTRAIKQGMMQELLTGRTRLI